MRKIKQIIMISLIILSAFQIMNLSNKVEALTIGTDVFFVVGNENYSVNSGTMEFSQIVIDSTNIEFNSSYFNVSSGGTIYFKLIKIANNILTASAGDVVMKFTGSATSGTTYFNISGFKTSYVYDIYKDTVFAYTRTTDSNGRINFSHASWSLHTFEVREQTANNAPVISNEYPATGATGIGLLTPTYVTVTDADAETMTVCFWENHTNPGTWTKSQQNNTISSGTVVKDISTAYVTHYSTKFWWYITAYDGIDNTTSATYSFTTKSNSLPVFTGETPANGSTGQSILLASWNVTIWEPNGETFDWTIQTTPYKGSSSANGASNGSKSTAIVTPLTNSTTYKVWVNATDGIGWKRAWYIFTTQDPGNDPPSVTTPYPANNTYGVILPLAYFRIYVSDPNGDTMNVTFNENKTTGSWRTFDSNATVTNGTYYAINTTWVTDYSTSYYWNISVNDGMGGWKNVTYYCFSSRNNTVPSLSIPAPANASTGVDRFLGLLSINLTDQNGDLMNATLQNNKTGSWVTFGTLANKVNGSYDVIVTWITAYSTKYWWKVFVNDSYGGATSGIYYFVTEANNPPVFGAVYPLNNSVGVSVGTPQFTIYISDDELFDWNITTSPLSSSSLDTSDFTGTKTCSLVGIGVLTLYTITVNATDSLGMTTSAVYYFTTASTTVPGGGGGGGGGAYGALNILLKGENVDVKIYQNGILIYVKSNVLKDTYYNISSIPAGTYTVKAIGVSSGIVKEATVVISPGQVESVVVDMKQATPGFEIMILIGAIGAVVLLLRKKRK